MADATDDRHENPSGLPDGHSEKKPQPVPEHHHEDGHECDCPADA